MERRLISSGSEFEKKVGYSRAVAQGPFVFVSGTTGFDYENMTIEADPAAQTEQALRNIRDALTEAGCGVEDIVRVRYLVPNGEDFTACAEVLGRWFADVRPAATMEIVGLYDERMKIEIEVTAYRA